jgi:hypothetical protein
MQHTDAGVAVGDAVVTFDGVAVLAPRGRFEIELYGSFMKLLGQVLPLSPSGRSPFRLGACMSCGWTRQGSSDALRAEDRRASHCSA